MALLIFGIFKSTITRKNIIPIKTTLRYLRLRPADIEALKIQHPPRKSLKFTDEKRYVYEFEEPRIVEDKRTGFEESKAEWHFVEKLIPELTIPEPNNNGEKPSGWKPQTENATTFPYFINRTRNHMVPVYLEVRNSGTRRFTTVKHIEGDIWLFQKQVKQFLEEKYDTVVLTQVHEPCTYVRFKGNYVEDVKNWLLERGF